MKKGKWTVLAFLALQLIQAPARAESCEKRVQLRLSQGTYSLDVDEHLKNMANATQFDLPVSCAFYDELQTGDNLLRKRFRWGDFAVNGSMSRWSLKVMKKYNDNSSSDAERCEKVLVAELSESHVSLELETHLRDTANRTRLQIPVGCDTFDRVKVGDDLFKGFRWGSFIINDSIGSWKLKVIEKRNEPGPLK